MFNSLLLDISSEKKNKAFGEFEKNVDLVLVCHQVFLTTKAPPIEKNNFWFWDV